MFLFLYFNLVYDGVRSKQIVFECNLGLFLYNLISGDKRLIDSFSLAFFIFLLDA